MWKHLKKLRWWVKGLIGFIGIIGIGVCAFIFLLWYSNSQSNSSEYIQLWFSDEANRTELTTRRQPCPNAPFILPSDGFIGLLWNDPAPPYNIFNRHTGIDIFGNGEPNEVPVYAVYEGYLTRQEDWVSTVIIQHDDPLNAGTKIWTYYTHMASRDGDSFIVDDFPPDTHGVWVEQGTLLGYQGEYSGRGTPIGLHVHLSIVKSEADGAFKNESDIDNTLDPSPYFGMELNIEAMPIRPIQCLD
jgi:hypothetical protein